MGKPDNNIFYKNHFYYGSNDFINRNYLKTFKELEKIEFHDI